MADTTLEIGAVLDGRYRIDGKLGEGGMAVVYLAHDLRLETPCAVKVLNQGPALHGKARDGFFREARVIARMHHPNIIGVRDVVENGVCYITMDLVRGESAHDRMRRMRVGPREALRIIADVLDGLHEAHRHRRDDGALSPIIHRDIKPENVLLRLDENGEILRAVIVDFGIAHFRPTGDPTAPTVTQATMGTPQYMAPEQTGARPDVDCRVDIFSVGATLWALLKGRMPDTIFMAEQTPEMLMGIPTPVAEIIVKAVQFKKERRYASAEEMLHAVRTVLAAQPEDVADALQPLRNPPRQVRRLANPLVGRTVNWRLASLLVVALALVIGVIVWSPWSRGETEPAQITTVTSPPAVLDTPTPMVEVPKEKPVEASRLDVSEPVLVAPPKMAPTTKPTEEDVTPRIVHKTVKKASSGSTVSINVETRNILANEVWLFSRTAGTTTWNSTVMRQLGKGYQATIVAETPGIEYYIDARPPEGEPITHGDRITPHVIIVTP